MQIDLVLEDSSGNLTEAKLLKHPWEISMELPTVAMLTHPSELLLKALEWVLSKVHASKISELDFLKTQKLLVGLWGPSKAAWKVPYLELKMAGLTVVKKADDLVSTKAEPKGTSLVEKKDSETGWHLESKMAGLTVVKKTDDSVSTKAEPKGTSLVLK
jgi:hypothetical protein